MMPLLPPFLMPTSFAGQAAQRLVLLSAMALLLGGALWIALGPALVGQNTPKKTPPAPSLLPALQVSQVDWQAPIAPQWQKLEARVSDQSRQNAANTEDVLGEDVGFTVSQDGQKKWQLHAQKALYLQNALAQAASANKPSEKTAFLKDLQGTSYKASGEALVAFKAPYGLYDSQNQRLLMLGGVKAQTAPEAGVAAASVVTMQAPQMSWSIKEPLIKAQGGVIMNSPSWGQTSASSAEFALDFSKITLHGGTVTQVSAL